MNDYDGVRMYTIEEIKELIEKADELGLDEVIDGSMTIGQLDQLVNGDAN